MWSRKDFAPQLQNSQLSLPLYGQFLNSWKSKHIEHLAINATKIKNIQICYEHQSLSLPMLIFNISCQLIKDYVSI